MLHEVLGQQRDVLAAIAQRRLEAQAAFVHDHLARWVPLMLARTRAAAPGPVLAAAATLADVQIALDAQRLHPPRHAHA